MKVVKRELKYRGITIPLYADTIELPDGSQTTWDYIDHVGAAAVVPVLDDGRILMVKQYRNTVDRMTLEIPAGKKETKEELGVSCASRELEEETGYKSETLQWILNIRSLIAFTNELVEVFVALDLKSGVQNLDEEEFIHVEAYEFSTLREMILDGRIEDGKTIAALLAYESKYLNS